MLWMETKLTPHYCVFPGIGFEKAHSERMKGTYRKVCDKLGGNHGLLFRYERKPAEGAFGVCGFWAVEYLALGGGTLQQAHELLGCC